MTSSAREILQKFDGLSEKEQKTLVDKLLLRLAKTDWRSLSEEEVTSIALERFLELDAAEKGHEKSKTRRNLASRPRNRGKNSAVSGS
jgi:hypothetical protein